MQIQLLPPPKKACLATRHSANMSKFQKLILCASLVVFAGCAHAAGETAEASLTVAGAVGSTIELLISTEATFTQSNSYGPLNFNLWRVSRSSELPPGWTKTINETSWALGTNLTATALTYNSDSQTYTLAAQTSGLAKLMQRLWGNSSPRRLYLQPILIAITESLLIALRRTGNRSPPHYYFLSITPSFSAQSHY